MFSFHRFDIQRISRPHGNYEQVIDDDITITSETVATFAQKMKASRLQLPSTFYLYETKPPCPGCRGCTDEFDSSEQVFAASEEKVDGKSPVAPQVPLKNNNAAVESSFSPFAFGASQISAGSSFSALASTASGNQGSSFIGSSGAFSGAGSQLFGVKSTPAEGDEGDDGEREHDPHYDAIVQVSKLDSVKTGEENDTVLFKHRAKLYRFDSQWKERGVGDIKLTRNVKTGYCRVLMRRDQIHKVCANHAIMPTMELKPLLTSDTSWVWFSASDYSDGVPPTPLQFCVKFKNKDVSEDFHRQFAACQETMVDVLKNQENKPVSDAQDTGLNQSTENDTSETEKVPESGNEENEMALKRAEDLLRKLKVANQEEVKNEDQKTTASPFSGFKFYGDTQTPKTPESTATVSKPALTIQTSKPAATQERASSSVNADPTSPGYYKEDDADIHVDAIVQVSKLNSLSTGEENEVAMFEERSKLFRFDTQSKSWKERGIGILKLAWDKSKNTCRVLMRREQIHKLCANHAIISSMKLKPMNNSDKAWTWFTQADISDGDEAKPESFCAKFKNSDIAQKFKEQFDECVLKVGGSPANDKDNSEPPKEQTKPASRLAIKFAAKPGTWNCKVCLVDNPPATDKCLACKTLNPDVKPNTKEEEILPAASEKSVFSFTSPSNTNVFENTHGFSFGGPAASTSATAFSFGGQTQTSLSTLPTFSFGKAGNTPSTLGLDQSSADTNAPTFDFSSNHNTSEGHSSNLGFGDLLNNSKSPSSLSANEDHNYTSSDTDTDKAAGPTKSIFAKFAPKSGSWECDTCLVNNVESAEKCVACMSANPNIKPSDTNTDKAAGSTKSIFAKFAPKSGSWECDTCLVNNVESAEKCVACMSPNPNIKQSVQNELATATGASQFNFGAFGNTSAQNTSSAGFTFGNSAKTAAPVSSASIFAFGPASEQQQKTTSAFAFGNGTASTTNNAGFSFGNQSTAPVFDNQSSGKLFGNQLGKTTVEQEISSSEVSSSTDSSKPKIDLKSKFAPPSGSWECPTCSITNKPSIGKCLACQTKNPDGIEVKTDESGEASASSSSIFNVTPQSSTSSFASLPASSTSGFSFPNSHTSSAGFTFGGNQQNTIGNAPFSFPTSSGPENIPFSNNKENQSAIAELDPSAKFAADPDTWECICLVRNAGYREVCRTCHAPRQKAPVVRLNIEDNSKPIQFPGEEQQQQLAGEKIDPIIVPNKSPATFTFSSSATNQNKEFTFGKESTLPKPDLSNFTKAEKERQLMPPPKDLPTISKTSPPKESSKKDSVFTWMPSGMNTENLFSLGSTPTPSLSNASSVDDLSLDRADPYKNVAAAFSNAKFSFSFDTPPAQTENKAPKTPPSFKTTTAADVASPTTPDTPGDGEPNIEFTPLVTLSQLNVQNTGEEDDIKMFSDRCKMFRFIDTQWKERGIGELKILRSKSTNQYRLIMRRDQIHKLCANHLLVQGMDIKPMKGSTKAFVWKTTADISDGEAQEQMFAARFKDEDTAALFSNVFNEAIISAAATDTVVSDADNITRADNFAANESYPTKKISTKPDVILISDDEDEEDVEKRNVINNATSLQHEDVQLIYEACLQNELKIKAKRLLLPETFFHSPSVKVGNTTPVVKTVGQR